MKIVLLTSLFIATINSAHCQQNKPNFRILAPQVICRINKNSGVETPPQITISMQTEGGQKLTYRVQMFFELLGGFRGQQHALSLWRAVRTMEKKINVKDKDSISDKNQINVNNTELVQGVFYVFKLIGIDESGAESEAQNFTVTYSDGKIKRTNADGSIIPDDITFLMLGSEAAYADVEYKVEANVMFCNPSYDYYFKWEISNLPESNKNIVQIPGNTLRIPIGVLKSGETYSITAKLLESNNSMILLSDTLDVKVKRRGFSAKLIPENVLIGISRPLTLKLYFVNSDNFELKPMISWSCQSLTNDQDCSMDETSEYQHTIELYKKGLYSITTNIQLDASTTLTSNISVDPDVIVMPFFKNPPTKAVQAEEHFEMETTLDGLIPDCFAFWTVLNETGHQFFDASLIPGGLGNLSVMDIDGNFLSELVDFVNSTISRDILLVVPKKGSFANWEGLKANSKYKFRLIMNCPAPISSDTNQTQNVGRRNVTSFADLTIVTNRPPIAKDLEITPRTGIGLKTPFKFSTGVASDEEIDYPLKYNFLIEFDGIMLSIGDFYENMVTTSKLPYSQSNISTSLEVCDSRGACSQINGPTISTTMPSDADINLSDTITSIKTSLLRLEYDESFQLALKAGVTFRNLNNSTYFTNFKNNFTKIIKHELNRLLENPTTPYYVPSTEIIKFIKYTKKCYPLIDADDSVNQGLLELLESTESAEKSGRQKRSVSKTSESTAETENINLNLDLMELKIASKNESISANAKKDLCEKVQTFIKRLCKDAEFTYANFDRSIVKMEVRKTNINQILRTNMTLPFATYERPAYIQINANLNVNPRNDFCVGKIMFPSDYSSGRGHADEIFQLFIVEKNISGSIAVVDVSGINGEENIFVSIPIKKDIGDFEVREGLTVGKSFPDISQNHQIKYFEKSWEMLSKELPSMNILCDLVMQIKVNEFEFLWQCQVFEQKRWSSGICTSTSTKNGYINCKCNKVDKIRVAEKMNPTTTSITSPHTTEAITTEHTANVTDVTGVIATLDIEKATTWMEKTTEILTTTPNPLSSSSNMQTVATELISTTPISVTFSDILPTINETLLNTTNMQIEIVTLPQINISTLVTTVSTTAPVDVVTELSKPVDNMTLPSIITNTFSQSTLFTSISSVNTNKSDLQKDSVVHSASYSSSTGYVLAVVFVLAGIFIVLAVFVYSRRKKPNSLAQQLEIIVVSNVLEQ